MEMEMLDNPLFSMDAKELLEFLESGKGITLEELQQAYQEQRQLEEDGYLYSLRELADFLGCSVTTAQKIKNSGKIPYQQFGRKVIFRKSDVFKGMRSNRIR